MGATAAAAVETPTHVSKVLPKRQPPAGPWHPLDVRNSIQRAQQEAERKRCRADGEGLRGCAWASKSRR